VVASLYFLHAAPGAYPIDDAYIHFAYADNLAAGRGLFLKSPGESGLGTTSAAWVGLLALGAAAGVPALASARALGVLALAATAGQTAELVRPAARRLGAPWAALMAGALVAVCGPLLWFSLSGMETMLFVALGLAGVLAYRSERWGLLGLSLGWLYLTRPEGLGLAAAIGLVEVVRHRRIPGHLWRTALLAALLALPWQGYVLWRTGELLPSSYYGKQFTQGLAIDYFAAQLGPIGAVARLRPVVFTALSLGYWFLYYWGGSYLPGPRLALAPAEAQLSLAPAGLGFVAAGLWVALVGRGITALWRGRGDTGPAETRAWFVLALWLVIHNGAFALLLPAPGTASRYIAIDYPAMCAAVALGLIPAALPGRDRWRWAGLGLILADLALAGLTGFTLARWREIYHSSARQIAEVRIPIAEAVEVVAPPETVVAAFDIGVIAYYADRPIADLGGLTDARFLAYAGAGRVDGYLCTVGARYLVAPDSSRQSGGSYYDYLGSLGLNGSPAVHLTPIAGFRMDEAAWQVGGAATGNSTAAVILYEVGSDCSGSAGAWSPAGRSRLR
jgi:hypothetical protein